MGSDDDGRWAPRGRPRLLDRHRLEVMHTQLDHRADAAWLHLALGANRMKGVDLGPAMRELNNNIGIRSQV
jgi:hypothetical protein